MDRRLSTGADAPGPRPRRLRVALAGRPGRSRLLLHGGCVTTGPWSGFTTASRSGPTIAGRRRRWPPEWIEAKDPSVQSRHLHDGDWWNVFQDPTLNSLIDMAYHQNLNLRFAARGSCKPGRSRRSPWATSSRRPSKRRALCRVNLSRNACHHLLASTLATGVPGSQLIPTGSTAST